MWSEGIFPAIINGYSKVQKYIVPYIILNDWSASEFFSPKINYLQHAQPILDAFKKFNCEMIECMYIQIIASTEGTKSHLLGPWDPHYLFLCLFRFSQNQN